MKITLSLLAALVLAACTNDAADDGSATAAGSGGVGGSGAGGASGAAAGQMGGGAGGVGGTGQGGAGAGGSGGAISGGAGGTAGTGGTGGVDAGGADAGNDAGDAGGMEPPAPVCPEGVDFPEPEVGDVTEDVCGDFDFAYPYNEGPTWIASEDAFFFTNFERGKKESGDIIKYTPGVGCVKFIEGVGCNGLAVSNDGNLLAACHQTRSIERFDVHTKMATPVAEMFMDELLDSPNDLVQHENGSIYFTNPTYELDGRDEGVGTAIFWIDRNGVLGRIEPTGNPNGIALTPDGSALFVVGSGRWDLSSDGAPSNHETANLSGDGVAMDCAGNLYTSGGAIRDAEGNNLGNFPGGTNMAFGGADRTTLLVVHGYAPTSVRAVQMNIPGLP